LNLWKKGFELGVNDDKVGVCSKIICLATERLKEGVDVLVTAPINKYNIQSEEFKFQVIQII
jgi:4-hydroxythreonine-4-phosphate dehydrogenase